MRVLVLHDVIPPDAPPDQLDALVQAEVFRAALVAQGHEVAIDTFRPDGGALLSGRPDLIVNLVESVGGEGKLCHLPTASFDLLGVPYTGSGTSAMAVTCHKRLCKQLLAARGVAVPADWPAGGPVWIVKSLWEHASVGLDDDCVVPGPRVEAAIERVRSRMGGEVVAETFVDGRELNVSMLETEDGVVVMPLAEIAFDLPAGKPHIVGYAAKWHEGSVEERGTPRTFDVVGVDRAVVEALVRRVWEVLGLRGYVRVDLRLDAAGQPYVLEVNCNPCLAPDAGFLAACARHGWDEARVVREIVGSALRAR
jgi:D-alanine-D-alanine ligase